MSRALRSRRLLTPAVAFGETVIVEAVRE